MIKIRRSAERGHAQHGWLNSRHTFSFADYYDPQHMGFRSLRVINEDFVDGGKGFGLHPHNDMEIITYVLKGALEHKDSMGNGSVINPGDAQVMSAGTGVKHSEFNQSQKEAVHLLQIWIVPDKKSLPPGYQQKKFKTADRTGKLCLIASRDNRSGSLKINQDADLYTALIKKGDRIEHPLADQRHAWVQVAEGAVSINGEDLKQGDGASISSEKKIEILAKEKAEVVLFDLA